MPTGNNSCAYFLDPAMSLGGGARGQEAAYRGQAAARTRHEGARYRFRFGVVWRLTLAEMADVDVTG